MMERVDGSFVGNGPAVSDGLAVHEPVEELSGSGSLLPQEIISGTIRPLIPRLFKNSFLFMLFVYEDLRLIVLGSVFNPADDDILLRTC